MVGRDSYPIRPATNRDADSFEPQDRTMRDRYKVSALVHRLHDRRDDQVLRDDAAQREDETPTMRLVRDEAPARDEKSLRPPLHLKAKPAKAQASIKDATDPRWVLALRTAESLQGTILGPEKRERLVKVGKLMGLTAFDANLVIAIVQDQARRGYAPQYCPAAGEPQLAMVPLPRRELSETQARTRRIGIICGVISVLVGLEIVFLKWLFS